MTRGMIGLAMVALMALATPAEAIGVNLFPKAALITLDEAGVSVRQALTRIAEEGGRPVLMEDAVSGTLNLHFREVPVTEAFLRVALSAGLSWQRREGAIVVRPQGRTLEAPTFKL